MSLRLKAIGAVKWTAFSNGAVGAVQLAQLAVLARFLTPADFGVMAVAAAVLSISNVIADGGFTSAYIQRRDVTEAERSSLYWINVSVALCLASVLVAASGFIGALYEDKQLQLVVVAVAPVLVLKGLGQQLIADAQKTLRFKQLAKCNIGASVVGAVVAVVAAAAGAGVFSLVWGVVCSSGSMTLLLWLTCAGKWLPTWRLNFLDIKSYASFGLSTVGSSLVNQLNSNMDLLLGGRFVGAAQFGFYSVPRGLVLNAQSLVNPIVTRVGFPLLAEVAGDTSRVRHIYLSSLRVVAIATAPIFLTGIIFAPQILTTLLGVQWAPAAPSFQILCAWGFFRSLANTYGSLLLGCGRPGWALKWNACLLLLLPAFITSGYYLGGLHGIAWAVLMLSVFLIACGWYCFIRPLCNASFVQYASSFTVPVITALSAALVSYAIVAKWDVAFVQLLGGSSILFGLHFALCFACDPRFAGLIRGLVKQHSKSSVPEGDQTA